ncbi:MAG: serine hydrolase [Bacteroidota bacterium]
MKKYTLLFYLLLVGQLSAQPLSPEIMVFEEEIEALQSYFHIPGLAILVDDGHGANYERYFGWADVERDQRLGPDFVFPIASLTKIFSAILIHQLHDAGQLSLRDPVRQHLPNCGLPEEVRIEHLLSHTSQGQPGEQFYYSFRFALLTPIIEAASGKDFATLVRERITEPLRMQRTTLLPEASQAADLDVTLAQPYALAEGSTEVVRGPLEYGYSASAGVLSTARDLSLLARSLHYGGLLSGESYQRLVEPYRPGLPYGLGIFSQRVRSLEVYWGYGQYDAYSSLYLHVPQKNLTFVLLANNNLLSDPARLINGDVTSSLFALAFFKYLVFSPSQPPHLPREQLLAQAMASGYMARYQASEWQKSVDLLDELLEKYPDYWDYGNLNLLHLFSFLKSAAAHLDLGPFDRFDAQLEKLAQQLLTKDPDNPYVHYYLGSYAVQKGDSLGAQQYFKHLLDLPNFTEHWYTREAKAWLDQH